MFRLSLLYRSLGLALVLLVVTAAQAGPYRLPARRDSLSLTAERLIEQAAAGAASAPGQSLADLKSAARIAGSAGNKEVQLRALRAQRDLELTHGASDAALATGVEALRLSTSIGDREGMALDLSALSRAYQRTGAVDEAVESAKRAVFLWKTTGDTAAIAKSTLELVDVLVDARRPDEAKHSSEDLLELFTAQKDTLGMARVWARQGAVFILQERFSEALSVLHRAHRALSTRSATEDLPAVLLRMAEANAGCGRWNDGKEALDQAEVLLRAAGRLNNSPVLFALRARIEEGAGELQAALSAQKRYAVLRDSLFSDRFAERVAGLRTLYELAAREKEIATLQAAEKNTAKAWAFPGWQWWMLAPLAAAIGGLIALVLMYRRMSRAVARIRLKNQVVNRQAEEIRTKNLELERQNMRLAETLMHEEEKDVILKEIHHRVKNNLQIASTLLRMQAMYAQDPRLEAYLHDCQSRILSMALVHEHIYKCGDLSRVNVKAHLMALGNSVLRNHGLDGRVALDLNVTYDRATLDDLVPLSLLLNELLTNAAKHAFSGDRPGRITIALRRLGEERCELTFSDNGIGLDSDRFFSTASFGLELVRTLAAQLNGTIQLLKGEGTTFQLTFMVKPERMLRKVS